MDDRGLGGVGPPPGDAEQLSETLAVMGERGDADEQPFRRYPARFSPSATLESIRRWQA